MDGILIIDKPAGWTSHDVVARARRLLRERGIGHTGTLDPFATGVLVLLVGRATRLAQFLSGAEKEYDALVRFGYATHTGDLTGTPREGTAAALDCSRLTDSRLEAALASLRGEIEQVPPMYSAKKVQGRKLYELARRGEEVERKAVRVFVREFELAEGVRPNDDGTCDVRARVVCSAGTYVRALAESWGELLGAGAHLAALRRTRAGAFGLADAVTLEALGEAAEAGRAGATLLPFDAALSELPEVHLTAEGARRARHGAPVRVEPAAHLSDGQHVRLHAEGEGLFAVGVYDARRPEVRTRVLLVPQGGAGPEAS
ncbi:MAG TPA: tRNA pseudouridine(55) synthase TruB [Pyrinomonadaceae bacterium]|nr:tRNA pseudouridine(55) synthase TruB [Pyrinomonadaceae bacterium]